VKVLKLLYQGTETVDTTGISSYGYWSPAADAMFFLSTSPTKEARRVYRDGTNIHISQISTNAGTIRLDQAPEAESGIVVYDSVRGGVFELHPNTWTPNIQKEWTTGITVTDLAEGVFLRNRAGVMKYYQQFARGYKILNFDTGTLEKTVEIFPSGANLLHPLMWVNNQTIAAFRSTGEMALWDVDTETMLLNSYIDAPHNAAIDTDNQLVVSIRDSDKTVQVYALEIEPNTFSAISATPGNYDRYHDEALSITVLGADSEPVPGVEVHWEVVTIQAGNGDVNGEELNAIAINAGATVVAAKGKISPAISITDASGIATATYCPPGNDWVSGDQETITAKVYI
jgi:hypothetical protein